VHNFDEHPQSILLTEGAWDMLQSIHPDGKFLIGQDSGIYYRVERPIETSHCVAPDWYYVPGVPQANDRGRNRKSYLMWEHQRSPLIVVEYTSNGGAEERDATPETGKFWIYEQILKPTYYAIFVPDPAQVEVYHLTATGFEPVRPNEAGRYPVPPMRMELGLWRGNVLGVEQEWLRWWTPNGELIPTGKEFGEQERRRADEEGRRADAATSEAERLRAKLRAAGLDPDAI